MERDKHRRLVGLRLALKVSRARMPIRFRGPGGQGGGVPTLTVVPGKGPNVPDALGRSPHHSPRGMTGYAVPVIRQVVWSKGTPHSPSFPR